MQATSNAPGVALRIHGQAAQRVAVVVVQQPEGEADERRRHVGPGNCACTLVLHVRVVHAQARAREHGEETEEDLKHRREAVDGVHDREHDADRRQERDHEARRVRHGELLDLVVVHDVDPHQHGPDHGRLVALLVHVLQCAVEHRRAEASDHDADKLQVEARLEAHFDAAVESVEPQQHEQRVADGVPELGDVEAVLVVELAPVDGGGRWPPEAHGCGRVRRAHARVLEDGHWIDRSSAQSATKRRMDDARHRF
ncbi:unnamed protein product [Phytophthora fragariaefolia]|uniref:Unnamed protein product n=1 Tax=Phytophthora fragariaefolia TaxID=1490495 RepID=A0A9W7CNV8_9STRA|nr:unnamed protein product [Phytophthora fragariaefolia]